MLREFELIVLQQVCRELHMSKVRHVSDHAIVKRFPGAEREARKALKKLITQGYVGRHPTGGEMTYQMTELGWDTCKKMQKEAR
ncbi:MAG TPA: hypothetical protein VLB04_01830 [Methanotrichaceae archaeon]|nr:hypothetical protein [Methanotrichaceae archaeon]